MSRVLLIGGAGEFGFRLADGLCATTDLTVIIAGRDLARAQRAAEMLKRQYPGRTVEGVRLDAAVITDADIRAAGAWLVADAAGPFQGAEPRVAQAAIAAGCHYVDLADARDFVARFHRLDQAARQANVLAVTGASSTPALTHAVLDRLVAGWQRIDRVSVAILPDNRQPRGTSVVKGILTYVGQPVRLWRGGEWRVARGWGSTVRERMPGLGLRWLSLVETPDLDLVPARFATGEAVFRAGLELSVLHLGLAALSKLVTLRLMRSLVPLAPALHWIAERMRAFGSDRGGMSVTAEGIDAGGRTVIATWCLVAANGHGPNVPTLPALAVIKALAAGTLHKTGAAPCVGLLTLASIAHEFARFRIVTRSMVQPRPLFARLIGRTYPDLPRALREGHGVDGRLVLTGRAAVEGAQTAFGRIIARWFGFPGKAEDVPVTVEMIADGDSEIWRRTIGGHRFASRLSPCPAGRGRVFERFGPFSFELAVSTDGEGLRLEIIAGRLGPLPLPRALLPRSPAREFVDAAGRFRFDVPISLPLVGLLVHYRGWLVPTESRVLESTPCM